MVVQRDVSKAANWAVPSVVLEKRKAELTVQCSELQKVVCWVVLLVVWASSLVGTMVEHWELQRAARSVDSLVEWAPKKVDSKAFHLADSSAVLAQMMVDLMAANSVD